MWELTKSETGTRSRVLGDVEVLIESRAEGTSITLSIGEDKTSALVPSVTIDAFTLVPAVPDRPVLFKYKTPLALLPHTSVEGWFVAPTWIRVIVAEAGGSEATVIDHPSVRLTKTWVGSNEAGEPAYTYADCSNGCPEPAPHETTVPYRIVNSTGALLELQSLLVRMVHLDLFLLDDKLTTNRVLFDFKGKDQESRISFQKSADVERTGGKKVADARTVVTNDIIKKSFFWIRDLTG